MRGVNRVTIVGNLGADPDLRFGANGNAVTKTSVATSEQWKDKKTNELQSRTEWHRVVFFGRLAEIAGEYLRKGSQVYIEGSLRTSSYEKDGQKHYSTDIIANEMQMLGGDGSKQDTQPRQTSSQAQRQAQPESSADDFEGDSIPF